MMNPQLAARVPQSKIELLEMACVRLAKDLEGLKGKMNNFYQGSTSQIINFRTFDDNLNRIISELTTIKESYSLNTENSGYSGTDFLEKQLNIIKETSKKLSNILSDVNKQKNAIGINRNNTNLDVQQKIKIDSDLKKLQNKINSINETTRKMNDFIQTPLNYGSDSDLELVKNAISSMKNNQINQYLAYAKESDKINDYSKAYHYLKQSIDEQKAKVDYMMEKLKEFHDIPNIVKQISQKKEEFDYITKTVNKLNGFSDSDSNNSYHTKLKNLTKSMEELQLVYENAQKESKDLLPTIQNSVDEILKAATKLLKAANDEKVFIDSLASQNDLDENYKSHMNHLKQMDQRVNNILAKQNEIQSNINSPKTLSENSLQQVLNSLSDMQNMAKFASYVGKRIEQLEKNQNKENQIINRTYQILQQNDNDLVIICQVLSSLGNKSNNNQNLDKGLNELQNIVDEKYNQALNLKDNHQEAFVLISSINQRITELSEKVDELEKRNSSPNLTALKLNEELETTTLQNYMNTKDEIMSVSRLIKTRFDNYENEIIKTIKEARKHANNIQKPKANNNAASNKAKTVVRDLQKRIQKRGDSVAEKAKLTKVKSLIQGFDKNSTSNIIKMRDEINTMLPQEFSPIDGEFAREIVERVDALSDTTKKLNNYASDISSGPIGNLKKSFQNIRKQANEYIKDKDIHNNDFVDESIDYVWQLPAFNWTEQPNLAYYSGIVGAKNPKIPNSDTQQLERDTKLIQQKALLAQKLKTRALKDKEKQIHTLTKLDSIKLKNSVYNDGYIPLLSHRINKLMK